MTTYLVQTKLALASGAQIPVPFQLFADKDAAALARKERQETLASLLSARLAIPKGAGEFDDAGISLGQALANLGILGFATEIQPIEVEDQRIAVVPRLVLP